MNDREPDYMDLDDDRKLGYCKRCDAETYLVKQDAGLGRIEYWGAKSVHHDWRDVCSECREEV